MMKMKLAHPLGFGLALLVAAPMAQAQTQTPAAPEQAEAGGEHHHGGGGHAFEAMDTNHDGVVTLDEWKAAGRREERFSAIDANHTGKITREDLHAYMKKLHEQREQNGGGEAHGDAH